jgi:hypothetical protein
MREGVVEKGEMGELTQQLKVIRDLIGLPNLRLSQAQQRQLQARFKSMRQARRDRLHLLRKDSRMDTIKREESKKQYAIPKTNSAASKSSSSSPTQIGTRMHSYHEK